MMDWNIAAQIVSIIAAVGGLTWFFSRQLNILSEKFFVRLDTSLDKIILKLEYHEKHDDQRFMEMRDHSNQRFGEIKDDIWQIRLRNASKDGYIPRPESYSNLDGKAEENSRRRFDQRRETKSSGS
jgi:hypothetical protein